MWRLLSLSVSWAGIALVAFAGVSAQRGYALYSGKEIMNGRIRGHDEFLPPETVRCANCHSARSSSRLSGNPAPLIDRAFLTAARSRRGGPPSRYDQAAFCQLLRSGSDPAHIVIVREMPAYKLNDDQCASLWMYLTEKTSTHETQ